MATSFRFETKSAPRAVSVLPDTRAGVVDAIGQGPALRVEDEIAKAHPLEARLAGWEQSQLSQKLHMQRQVYGLHAPMRAMMELQAVRQTPSLLGSRVARMQSDILLGREDTLDVTELFDDCSEADTDVHKMLAARLGV
ncbi:hypothetical protein IWQ57_000031 [Coemansia nantahalensis]|uniref:Uncharacterized protein n=2 Tax=Coemansia TaxID=4863 RepID=A0ACC1L0B1_9FUNG|nr:hypothetical protein IWQ57_000031 [Coemansia nantahalensis]KAJ2798424.1 hypothetical protein H4R21_003936 [Coemansia helicoidea]